MPTPDLNQTVSSTFHAASSDRPYHPHGDPQGAVRQRSLQAQLTSKTAGIAFAASVLFAALAAPALHSTAAYAAGLDKINVLSALGQPLRAEIDVTSVGADTDSLTIRLAPVSAYAQANVEYNSALANLRFSLEHRANGQTYARVTSSQPINDPYVDMLVELNWNSGRLVRQYTFLLDPPELKAATTPAETVVAVTPPPARSTRSARAERSAAANPSGGANSSGTASAAVGTEPYAGGNTYHVNPGDTALKIARATKPEEASVDQMLAALVRNNQSAFVADNVNRLKAGSVLHIPDAQNVQSITAAEARRSLNGQANDFSAYRASLAKSAQTNPLAEAKGSQKTTSGKVTGKLADVPLPATASQDQVKVSKLVDKDKDAALNASTAVAASAGKQAAATSRASEELAAKDRAIQEANTRVSLLEKNVADLEKLVQLKNQNLSELQKQVQTPAVAKPDAKIDNKTAAPVAPVPNVATSSTSPLPASTAPASSPAAPETVPAVVPVAGKPVVKKDIAKPVPKPVEEPGFFEGLMENRLALFGVLGIVVALILYAVYYMRRKDKFAKFEDSFLAANSGLRANSLFGMTGGQSVDTSNSSFNSNFMPQPGATETNEVDPVAEADVYIAYGRDAQAEEILKEALRTQPERHAVRLKLLEIYARREDAKSFETVANELYAATTGQGEEWREAALLGRKIDANNPLYAASATEASSAGKGPNSIGGSNPAAGKSSGSSLTRNSKFGESSRFAITSGLGLDPGTISGPTTLQPVLDSDLTRTEPLGAPTRQREPAAPAAKVIADDDLDFSLDPPSPPLPNPSVAHVTSGNQATGKTASPTPPAKKDSIDNWAEKSSVDFSFDLNQGTSSASFAKTEPMENPFPRALPGFQTEPMENLLATAHIGHPVNDGKQKAQDNVDFDLTGAGTKASAPEAPAASHSASEFASQNTTLFLGAQPKIPEVNLDLSKDSKAPATSAAPASWQEMATKLDLAMAYKDIGDKEGARELLEEVVKGGDSVQSDKAKELLAALS